jgi:cold shock CspA family protein
MKLPIEILTKGFGLSDQAREDIRAEAEKLDLFYGRIMRCHVAVEGPGGHARQGRWHVVIDIRVPGAELTVTRQRGETLREAIRESFAAATRRVEDYVRRTRRLIKSSSKPQRGTVTQLFPERGFGFLVDELGRELYFHQNSVAGQGFGRLKPGTSVLFADEQGDEGPQASTVRPSRRQRRTARRDFARQAPP